MLCDTKLVRMCTASLVGTNKSVYDLFKWKVVHVQMLNRETGEVLVDMPNATFPAHFSQKACDIIASKYFRRSEEVMENNYRDLVHRMTHFWVTAMVEERLIGAEQYQDYYDEIAYLLISQAWAPNSPQFFNTGLFHSYGIRKESDNLYYYDPETEEVKSPTYAYERTAASACYIRQVEDALCGYKSISDELGVESLLFKYGSGIGVNWSTIRGKDEPLSVGGKSSGLMSFLKVSDKNAGAIKSGGTTRRASKINILDIDHPEIMEFIEWKAKEEDKVVALHKMGYSIDIDGEAYETVSGQNVNNSVRVTDEFMRALQNRDQERMHNLVARVTGKVAQEVDARELWQRLCTATWRCGDPGIQFDDTINSWHTCPLGEDGKLSKKNRINATNPCSEYMYIDDSACNLASLNLLAFWDIERRVFDFDKYMHTVYLVQMVLEATIYKGVYPTKEIAYNSYKYRTTGVGWTNFGALLLAMSLPYDSSGARAVGGLLTSLMTGVAYLASSHMAKVLKPFDTFELNKEYMLDVIARHAYASGIKDWQRVKVGEGGKVRKLRPKDGTVFAVGRQLQHEDLPSEFCEGVKHLELVWPKVLLSGEKHGFRNAQVSLLAPTGTIAFAMDCLTTSSEPFLGHVVYKKLVGGSSLQIVNELIPVALKNLGYTSDQIANISAYILENNGMVEGAPELKEEHLSVFDTANKCGKGSRYLSPEAHIGMVAALTPHLSGGISKTVNLPNTATIEDVDTVFMKAWQEGIKCITVYVDGCKMVQPLMTSDNASIGSLENFSYNDLLEYAKEVTAEKNTLRRVKPTGIRDARVHEAHIGNLKLYVTISFYDDGRLGEIYVSAERQGSLIKGLLDSMSITLSKMLQYGAPPEDIARTYRGQKYEPNGFVSGHPYIKFVDSISDLISKIIDIELRNYDYCQVKPEGYVSERSEVSSELKDKKRVIGAVCGMCKSTNLVQNGTCKVCTDCGCTTGCS